MSVVGIDLGTTNTVIASARNGRVSVLLGDRNEKLLPSVVSFHPNGESLVGRAAKDRRAIDAKNTVYSVKRLLGKPWQSAELTKARTRFPFELREGPAHSVVVRARGRDYSLPEISGMVLRRARAIAEESLQTPVERAVITVPAHFNELQRSATKVAGRIAGLEILRILNEPTAAALAYGLGRGGKERIAVYDFGGGTFDCTLLDLSGNIFEVLATSGDTFLGGDDIDGAIADRMAEAFMIQHRYDIRGDSQSIERLRIAAEQIKIELSTQASAHVRLRELAYGAGGSHLELSFEMTREELDALTAPFVEKTLLVCQDALSLAGMNTSSFDKVILVGGSTRIPQVKARVESFFGRACLDRINPDEIVGIGAAIQAAALGDVRRSHPVPPPPLPRRSSVPPPPDSDPTEINRAITDDDFARVTARVFQELRSDGDVKDLSSTARDAPALDLSTTAPIDLATTASLGGAIVTPRTPRVAPPRAAITQPLPPPSPPAAMPPSPLPGSHVKTLPPPPLTQPPFTPSETRPILPSSLPASMKEPGAPARMFPPPPSARTEGPSSEEPTVPRSSFKLLAAQLSRGEPATASTARMEPAAREATTIAHAYDAHAAGTANLPSPAPRPPPSSIPPPLLPKVAPVLLDVTPRALVVETVGGFADTIVPRNAKIPCERTRGFATSRDEQTTVQVRVAQGESLKFSENVYLGELELSGLRAAPRGEVTISVTFAVDSDGTLQVTASDLATSRQAFAQLRLIGGMSPEEIQRARERLA